MSERHHIGQRISYDGAVCTVRFIGPVEGTTGDWLGIEWDDASRGKHDGTHKGARYFSSHTAASFVRPNRPADAPQSFVSALHEKYVLDSDSSKPRARIYFSTKLAEEVGFDKIWRQQSQLQDLKIVVLENSRIGSATRTTSEQDGERDGEEASIAATCPKITQLDLSRNLFEGWGPVADVCQELEHLQKLSINGNRFRNVLYDEALKDTSAFAKVKDLALADMMLSWEELVYIANSFPSLTTLLVGTNQLSSLPLLPSPSSVSYGQLSTTLTSINLEFNDFTSIAEIASLADLKALRSICLKGNNISSLSSLTLPCCESPNNDNDSAHAHAPPAVVFPDAMEYLDLSYNKVASWGFVDGLTACFPGLAALRISHNPIYDDFVDGVLGDSAATHSSDDSFMFTIARIAQLKTLNFSTVTTTDRANAEMFYLSRIAKQLARVPEGAEHTVTALHPRWDELCRLYGRPDVVRREEINPSFLEARLIEVDFRLGGGEASGDGAVQQESERRGEVARIPKSFDIYKIKGIVGRLFNMSPLKMRLVWETGEWDPVAGFDEQDGAEGESDEEGEGEGEGAGGEYRDTPAEESKESKEGKEGDAEDSKERPGRWVKREVELKDGPKLLGYCVDGSRVSIRVESVL
ncbi:Tubulin-specific chaperone E [Escovopsis weberi]|uniref:Tubulin-specific chaperone E n=1 Tax=Escovopsis weberi TaxID=150374 RepID=A0A0M8N1L4_ESCWE|nr:Tubulin-specific chaperone E [Escovopsis weberi]